MALNPRTRWILYGVAGAATAAAMVWVDRREQAPTVVAATPRTSAAAATSARAPQPPEGDTQVRLEWLKRRPGEELPRANPFGPQAPSPQQQQAQAQPPAPPPPPPPPQAPPLPYTYMGKWTEKGQTTIFLTRGERHVTVRGVGKLDENYTVEALDDRQIVLLYTPLGVRQVLPLVPGAPAVQQAAGAPPPAQEDSNEETN